MRRADTRSDSQPDGYAKSDSIPHHPTDNHINSLTRSNRNAHPTPTIH